MKRIKYFGTDGEDTFGAMRKLAERLAGELAAADKLSEEELSGLAPLFPRWNKDGSYAAGAIVRTEEGIFKLNLGALGGKRPAGLGSGWSLLGGGR